MVQSLIGTLPQHGKRWLTGTDKDGILQYTDEMKIPMRSLFLFLALVCCASISQAQSFTIAPGVTYRMEEELEGLHLRAYYALPKWLSFGPEFSYFKPVKYEGDSDGDFIQELSRRRVWAFDFNAHLDIKLGKVATIYPLAGLNVTNVYEIDAQEVINGEPNVDPTEESIIGFNAGGGIHLFPKQMGPFFEYKYTFGDLKVRTITLGIVFRIQRGEKSRDWVRDHEDIRLK